MRTFKEYVSDSDITLVHDKEILGAREILWEWRTGDGRGVNLTLTQEPDFFFKHPWWQATITVDGNYKPSDNRSGTVSTALDVFNTANRLLMKFIADIEPETIGFFASSPRQKTMYGRMTKKALRKYPEYKQHTINISGMEHIVLTKREELERI